jgi:hypothetical protein
VSRPCATTSPLGAESAHHLHSILPDLVVAAAIAGVALVAHAQVNSLGRYELNRQPPPAGQLRPLRLADDLDVVGPLGVIGDKH